MVAGTSAGGNVAAVAAHEAVDAKLSPPLTGVYLNVPTMVYHDGLPDEYKQHHHSYEQNKDARILDKKGMEWFWGMLVDSICSRSRTDDARRTIPSRSEITSEQPSPLALGSQGAASDIYPNLRVRRWDSGLMSELTSYIAWTR